MQKFYYVYIMTNKYNKILYTGITNNLVRRIYEHKTSTINSFTSKYKLTKLIYYEVHEDVNVAINREKRLKKWGRSWKFELILKQNPGLGDLYYDVLNW
ncbi:MAG: GIY-YIG nuclease family protein [Patescibacteria group bacterium]